MSQSLRILVGPEGVERLEIVWPPNPEVFRVAEAILPALGLMQAMLLDAADARRAGPARSPRRSRQTPAEATR